MPSMLSFGMVVPPNDSKGLGGYVMDWIANHALHIKLGYHALNQPLTGVWIYFLMMLLGFSFLEL